MVCDFVSIIFLGIGIIVYNNIIYTIILYSYYEHRDLQEALAPVYEVNEFPENACCNDCPCLVPVVPVHPVRVSYRSLYQLDECAIVNQRSQSQPKGYSESSK